MITVDKIKPTSAIALLAAVSIFSSIQLTIFLLHENLFQRLDLFRLILVGIGLSSPILFVNALLSVLWFEKSSGERVEDREKFLIGAGGLISTLLISFLTLISFTYSITLYRTLWNLFWVESGLFVLTILWTALRRALKGKGYPIL